VATDAELARALGVEAPASAPSSPSNPSIASSARAAGDSKKSDQEIEKILGVRPKLKAPIKVTKPKNSPDMPEVLRTVTNAVTSAPPLVNAWLRDDNGGWSNGDIGKAWELVKRGRFDALQREYGFGSEGELAYGIAHGDPIMKARKDHPLLNAGMAAAEELVFDVPGNFVGGKVFEGASAGLKAARAASPFINDTSNIIGGVAKFATAPVRLPMRAAGRALKNAVEPLVNRYYDVRKGAAAIGAAKAAGESQLRAKDAAMATGDPIAHKRMMEVFGVDNSLPKSAGKLKRAANALRPVQGLTKEQRMEIENRSQVGADGEQINPRNEVPEPAGLSLDERAGLYRKYIRENLDLARATDPEIIKHAIGGDVDGTYIPNARFDKSKPIYTDPKLEEDAIVTRDGYEPIGASTNIYHAGGGYGGGRYTAAGKVYETYPEMVARGFHPDRDPAFQFFEHQRRILKAINNSKSQKIFEQPIGTTTTGGNPLAFREPTHYETRDPRFTKDESGQTKINFGSSLEGGQSAAAKFMKNWQIGMRSREAIEGLTNRGLIDPNLPARRVTSTSQLLGRMNEAKLEQLRKRVASKGAGELAGAEAGRVANVKFLAQDVGKSQEAVASHTATINALKDHGRTLFNEYESAKDVAAGMLPAAEFKAAVQGRADQLLEEFNLTHGRAFDAIGKRGIIAGFTRTGPGKYQLAGEYADVPKYLMQKKRISDKDMHAGSNSTKGNADELAANAGMTQQEFFDTLRKYPNRMKRSDALVTAREDIARQGITEGVGGKVLADLAHHGSTAEEIKSTIQGKLKEVFDALDQAEAGHAAATGASQPLSATARAVVDQSERFSPKVAKLVERVQKTGEDAKANVDRLAVEYNTARTDKAQKALIRKEVRRLLKEHDSTVEEVDRHFAQVPVDRNGVKYIRESDLNSGVPGAKNMTLQADLFKTLAQQGQQRLLEGESGDGIRSFAGFMQTLSNLSRTGILIFPIPHVWNLTSGYLHEGGDLKALLELWKKPDVAMEARAEAAGAVAHIDQRTIGAYGPDSARVNTASTTELNPLQNVDRYFTQRLYGPSQKLLFDVIERRMVAKLFEQKIAKGATDGEAAAQIRKALGDYGNITAFERKLWMTKIFNFYPFLKTIIPFYVQKGLIDPRAFTIPITAIRANNQAQGYDDPSQPFTMTTGHDATGYSRWSVPMPIRVLENVADAAKTPYDFARGMQTGNYDALRTDSMRAVGILKNRMNPVAAMAPRALTNVFDRNPPPWDKFITDGYASPAGKVGQIAGSTLGDLFAPAGQVRDAVRDGMPVPHLAASAMGGFVSKKYGDAYLKNAKGVRARYHKRIAAASAAGDYGKVRDLEAAQEAEINRAPNPAAPHAALPTDDAVARLLGIK